jgi:hypothetical protein
MAKRSRTSGSSRRGTSGGAPIRTATPRRPPLTDAERHKRFKEMAREVEASDNPEDFDTAFRKVTESPPDQS